MAWSPPSRRPSDWQGKVNRDQFGRVLSRTDRGYDYQWEKVRRAVLAKNPLCIDCERAGRTEPAAECHHVQPIRTAPERRLDVTNVAPLCERCHDRWEAQGPPVWWPAWVREAWGVTP